MIINQEECEQIGMSPLDMVDVINGEAYCRFCHGLAEDHLVKEAAL